VSVRPDDARRLGAVYEDLRRTTPPGPDPKAWFARMEADAALAGLISRVLNQGTVTPEEVADARALTDRAGTAADPARVAAAYELLAQQTA
jgi:hypothetical protein